MEQGGLDHFHLQLAAVLGWWCYQDLVEVLKALFTWLSLSVSLSHTLQCLYHYKPSWAKLQQMLKNKLDTISSLTIGKTKDTRPLTPQEDPNSTEFLPCLLPFEAQLVWLVLQLSCYYGNQANKGGVNGQKGLYLVEFKELLYTMITKESKRFHLKCALM